MSDKMVTLATFLNPLEAELVVGRLRSEGIRVGMFGDTASSIFAGVGGLAHVQVLVAEEDYDRALDILESEPELPDEEREPNTSIKESGRGEAASSQIRGARISPLQSEPPNVPHEEEVDETIDDPELDVPRPGGDEFPKKPRTLFMTPDTVAHRALLASLFSFMCFLLGFYSLWLLIGLPFMPGELSRKGTIKAVLALLLNVALWAGLGLWTTFL